MPPLEPGPPVSRFEFWPPWLFYLPIWLWIILLMVRHRGIRLPLLVNPTFPAGGLVGEEKGHLFALLSGPERHRLPNYIVVQRTDDPVARLWSQLTAQLAEAGLTYPLVAKPDIGCRGAGVRPIRSPGDLWTYVADFPAGANFLVQRMIDTDGEAGVFYVREPGQRQGRIISLTLKYFPHVVGDGRATLGELIRRDPRAGRVTHLYRQRFAGVIDTVPAAGETVRLVFSGSHSKGAIFRNGNAWVTEAMRARFDAIADGIPGFHFGRFDVRFADFEAFRRGEDFAIIEYNGAGAEATHIWDSRTTVFDAWRDLARQHATLFRIGAAQRRAGARPDSWRAFIARWQRERTLVKAYPETS